MGFIPILIWVRRRKARLILGLAAASLVGLWLAVHYIPAWFIPLELDENQLRRIRAETTRLIDDVSDALASGRPIEISLDARQINEILAALPELYPEMAWPPGLSAPIVRLEPGAIRVGAKLSGPAGEAIVSLRMAVRHDPDAHELHLLPGGFRVGGLALPRALLAAALSEGGESGSPEGTRAAEPQGKSAAASEALSMRWITGRTLSDRQVWPNGKRPFQIVLITIENNRIRLKLSPLG